MKNVLLIFFAIILAIIALSSIGPMISMAISLLIVYASLKYFLAAQSIGVKIIWALIGFIGLSGLISSLPALIGIAAVYLLYMGYKHWNEKEENDEPKPDHHPFTGFESQWKDLESKLKS